MQYHALPCNTMQYNAVPCNTMQYHAIPCNTRQYHAIPCYTMQHQASPYETMQLITKPFNIMQCNASLVHNIFPKLQGLSERMAKVICTAGVFIFTKSQFSQLFPLQNWRQITPPAHPGPSGSFSALPQRWRCLFMRKEEGKGRLPRETSAQLPAILDNLGALETRSPNNGEDY